MLHAEGFTVTELASVIFQQKSVHLLRTKLHVIYII